MDVMYVTELIIFRFTEVCFERPGKKDVQSGIVV